MTTTRPKHRRFRYRRVDAASALTGAGYAIAPMHGTPKWLTSAP